MPDFTPDQENRDLSFGSRLSVLEYKVSLLQDQSTKVEAKLDELLALRQKGMGAFWLASSLLGTGIIGLVFTLVSWMRG